MTSLPHFRQLVKVSALVSLAFIGIAETAIAQDRSLWLTHNSRATLQGYFLQDEDIFAFCDADCQDIDLFLYSEQGNLVDSDDAIDVFPIVTAPYDGNFIVEVTLPACSHSAGCAVSISSDFGF
ncbi:MAG: hypothetical protein AAFQ63_00650 [Cyanobacteria bacterium J06621_11]